MDKMDDYIKKKERDYEQLYMEVEQALRNKYGRQNAYKLYLFYIASPAKDPMTDLVKKGKLAVNEAEEHVLALIRESWALNHQAREKIIKALMILEEEHGE